jgi:hypothetical protein
MAWYSQRQGPHKHRCCYMTLPQCAQITSGPSTARQGSAAAGQGLALQQQLLNAAVGTQRVPNSSGNPGRPHEEGTDTTNKATANNGDCCSSL